MTAEPDDDGFDADDRVAAALRLACLHHPYLSGLAAGVEVWFSKEVGTAGVTASGKLLVDEEFIGRLSPADLGVIMTHELLHLFRQVHERSEGAPDLRLVNIADDLIVNDLIAHRLREEDGSFDYRATVLNEGLMWERFGPVLNDFLSGQGQAVDFRPAREYSLEEMAALLLKYRSRSGMTPFSQRGAFSSDELPRLGRGKVAGTPEEAALGGADGAWSDVLGEDAERRLFPDEDPAERKRRREEFRALARKAAAEGAALEAAERAFKPGKQIGRGTETPSAAMCYDMLHGIYRAPWEGALQRWFDVVAPGDRSWARPSRRGAFRTDVVLPGRKREGWILHLALDTSGSMVDILPAALGSISMFCEANAIESVHIVQGDVKVQSDEYISPDDLLRPGFRILGLGDNDFAPIFEHIAADPEIESVVVLTDGYFDLPPEPPFSVLWAIIGDYADGFREAAEYGTVIGINP